MRHAARGTRTGRPGTFYLNDEVVLALPCRVPRAACRLYLIATGAMMRIVPVASKSTSLASS
jgi:hypothetical protein